MIEISDEGAIPSVGINTQTIWKRRLSVLSKYIGAQSLIQLMSLFAGFLLVRRLAPQEYAFFTVVGTMQGTIGVISESGVGSALSSIGGKVWQDKFRFGQLIQTALAYRKNLWIVGSAIVTPILFWTLLKDGATPLYALALCFIVILSTNFQLSNGVLDLILKMHTRIDLLQRTEFIGAFLRTACIIAVCLTFKNTLLAVTATLAALILQNNFYKRYASSYIDFAAPTNDQDRTEITTAVKHVSPTTIFYCFQGQITIFLVSFFGNIHKVAAIGALSRLGVIFLVINTVMSNILMPRFARCQESNRLKKMYWQILGVFVLFSLAFVSLTSLLPTPFLWLIGSNYSHLSNELPYAVTSAVVGSVGAVIYGLNFSRAWMRRAWLAVPIVLTGQIILLPFLNLGSVRDVLLLSIIPPILGWIPYLFEANGNLKLLVYNET